MVTLRVSVYWLFVALLWSTTAHDLVSDTFTATRTVFASLSSTELQYAAAASTVLQLEAPDFTSVEWKQAKTTVVKLADAANTFSVWEEPTVTSYLEFAASSTGILDFEGGTELHEVIAGTSTVIDHALAMFAVGASFTSVPAHIIDNSELPTFCWYPISGNYGLLPRSLFYLTIVFALIARRQPWLMAGALAAALTYSGAAAVHACLLVWRGPGMGELDRDALLAILSASCIITVPLLNWSETLRKFGQPKEENGSKASQAPSHKGHSKDQPTRTIIVYWGFLVTVGFMAIFVSFFDDELIISPITLSGAANISCVPPPGKDLNLSAGQSHTMDGILQPLIPNREFIEINHCLSESGLSKGEINKQKFIDAYQKLFSGKRAIMSPKWVAKYFALIMYAWAIFIIIICPPLFIFGLVANELHLLDLPQSETARHIGAWTPYALTILVLLAALAIHLRRHANVVTNRMKIGRYWILHIPHEIGRRKRARERDVERHKWPDHEAMIPTRLSKTRQKSENPTTKVKQDAMESAKNAVKRFYDYSSWGYSAAEKLVAKYWKSCQDFRKNPEECAKDTDRHGYEIEHHDEDAVLLEKASEQYHFEEAIPDFTQSRLNSIDRRHRTSLPHSSEVSPFSHSPNQTQYDYEPISFFSPADISQITLIDELPPSNHKGVPPSPLASSSTPLSPSTIAGEAGLSPRSARSRLTRSCPTVSLLQVERPGTQLLADEIRLRRGENGVYHVIQE